MQDNTVAVMGKVTAQRVRLAGTALQMKNSDNTQISHDLYCERGERQQR